MNSKLYNFIVNQKPKIYKKLGFIYFFITLFVIVGGIFFLSFLESKEFKNYEDHLRNFHEKYGVYALELPETIEFAREKVPLQNFDVKESLDAELHINTYWHSRTFLMIKRANRYFPVIEQILKEEGVPDDFKYLVVAESGFENVKSPSGAVGFWQFLKSTAIDYGLEVNAEVDERYNLEKSTRAACKYFKKSYEKYHNWTLVAASYNMGSNGLQRQIVRQKSYNYYDLLLSEETARYVFRVLAFKLILSNPKEYGFYLRDKDLYPIIETYDLKIDSTVNNFADFAIDLGINYKILKYFNPWLRSNKLTNLHRKTYTLKIIKDGSRESSYADSIQIDTIDIDYNDNDSLEDN